ncbi:Lrp/AsnC family transcriptional regulator [Vibrio salinus]|uniref:Lrp/AsnC family transcriptional regulator n=1 Tax=Vibrio salinus TaxID=2899784 RepID=UPI001E3D28E8|nr:Lrp/AsnC family transcriptional regulator [Vibrio salinus]MCE0492948.1 Lrp/AsnC family transcriptional regulator [Vibrio salinus]
MNKQELTNNTLDDTDLSMLRHIQREGRISNSKLSEKVNLSETPCWRRWKRLEDSEYIKEYIAVLNRKKLGFSMVGFTLVTLSNHEIENTDFFEQFVSSTDWIPMCHCIAGGADYIVEVIAHDLDEYYDRISQLRRVKGVSALHSNISVKEIKTSHHLPLD